MAEVSVAILGFGRIGTSIALALNRYNAGGGKHHFTLTGFDNRPGVEKAITKKKVVDTMARRAYDAVRDKDIIVIAMPYSDVEATYELIGADVRPGAVVLDMSPLKQPSLEWAKKHLPEGAHLVGVTPVVNGKYLFEGIDDHNYAREDLFDDGSVLLMPSPSCVKDAVELAVDFATLLGAAPHFVDLYEYDGLVAFVEGLPSLLGVAAFYSFYRSQGWHDGERMANPAFGVLTHHLFDTHPDDLRDRWLNNRDGLLRALDGLIGTLREFQTALYENDQNAVEAAVVEASEVYEQWYNRRLKNQWDDTGKQEKAPSGLGQISQGLMGSFLSGKLRGGKDSDD